MYDMMEICNTTTTKKIPVQGKAQVAGLPPRAALHYLFHFDADFE
jgi:hypothetical protein